MANIGIIGAGNVGANIAFFVLEQQLASVTILDSQKGLGTGKALDIMEAAPLREFSYNVHGTDDLEDMMQCSAIVIAAGKFSTLPEVQLFEENFPIIEEYAKRLSQYKGVVVIVSDPSEVLATLFIALSGLPPERVIASGCSVDTIRIEHLIAHTLSLNSESIAATIIGTQGSQAILLPKYTRVSGMPLEYFLRQNEIEQLRKNMQSSNDTFGKSLSKTGAYYGPAAAASTILRAIICDTNSMLNVGAYLNGQYQCTKQVMSVPSMVSASGIHKVIELELDAEELSQLHKQRDVMQTMTAGAQKR